MLATQNPIEYEGTFPLPEAQLDRFLMRISLGYPDRDMDEIDMLERQRQTHPLDALEQVVDVEELIEAQQAVNESPRRPADQGIHRLAGRGDAASTTMSTSAPARAARWRSTAPRARWAALRGARLCHPGRREGRWPSRCLAHRLIVSPAARMKNIDGRWHRARTAATSTPVPGARAASPGASVGSGILRGRRAES